MVDQRGSKSRNEELATIFDDSMLKLRKSCVVVGVVLLYLYFNICQVSYADPTEADPLRNFVKDVDQRQLLQGNWTGSDPCTFSWKGVLCKKGVVYNLILESMGLTGFIPNDTLSVLANLRRISLKNNSLAGPLPDLSNSARSLLAVWLHYNQFSGPIPEVWFANAHHLRRLFLSNNQLSGVIPVTLTFVANLSNLHLESNLLFGSLPTFNQASLKEFNVSFNHLTGPIPPTNILHEFPESSFTNNSGLCGPPLSVQCSGTPGKDDNPAESPAPDTGYLAPEPSQPFSPAQSEPDVGAPAPWQPSGVSRVHEQRHGSRNAILAIAVGVFLML